MCDDDTTVSIGPVVLTPSGLQSRRLSGSGIETAVLICRPRSSGRRHLIWLMVLLTSCFDGCLLTKINEWSDWGHFLFTFCFCGGFWRQKLLAMGQQILILNHRTLKVLLDINLQRWQSICGFHCVATTSPLSACKWSCGELFKPASWPRHPQRYVSVLHLLFLIKPAQVSKQKTLTYIVGGGVSFLWAASQASEVEHS